MQATRKSRIRPPAIGRCHTGARTQLAVLCVAVPLWLVCGGCAVERAMDRASGMAEAVATKALDRFDPQQILARMTLDATNPEYEGEYEVYQAWGVRHRNKLGGVIARGAIDAAGTGGGLDDPELRALIAAKLGDPTLTQLDALLRVWQTTRGTGTEAGPTGAGGTP